MTRTHCKNFCGRTTPSLGWRGSACLCLAWFSTGLVTAAAGEGKPDGNKGFLENGSFEAIQRLAAPPKGNDFGTWVLKSDLQAPTAWTLNAAFPGALEVAEGGAADGKRFLRLAAGANRAAHLIQSCPQLRPGLTYKVTLRYRGGPVELKVYEYDAQNKLKTDRPFAEGLATPVRNGAWATLEGVYALPDGIAKATLVVCCAGPQRSGPGRRARRAVRQAGDGRSTFEPSAPAARRSKPRRRPSPDRTALCSRMSAISRWGSRWRCPSATPTCAICISGKWESPGAATRRRKRSRSQVRGYDGSLGNWTVYMLDFAGTTPPTFRWSDDLALDLEREQGADHRRVAETQRRSRGEVRESRLDDALPGHLQRSRPTDQHDPEDRGQHGDADGPRTGRGQGMHAAAHRQWPAASRVRSRRGRRPEHLHPHRPLSPDPRSEPAVCRRHHGRRRERRTHDPGYPQRHRRVHHGPGRHVGDAPQPAVPRVQRLCRAPADGLAAPARLRADVGLLHQALQCRRDSESRADARRELSRDRHVRRMLLFRQQQSLGQLGPGPVHQVDRLPQLHGGRLRPERLQQQRHGGEYRGALLPDPGRGRAVPGRGPPGL